MKSRAIAGQREGALSAGARLLWRRQEILWWVFAVNVGLGGLGTLGAARTLNAALGYSLAGNQLVKGFDLGMLYELIRLPEGNFLHSGSAALACAALFAGFVLFVSGGILEAFRQGRRLNTGDFFAASGAFFWRFVRLALFMLVPVAGLRFAYRDVRNWSEYLGDKAAADQVGFLILAMGIIALALVAVIVRVWFDIAKVRTVAQNERGMWRIIATAFDMTFRHLGTLLWIYLRITLVGGLALLIGFVIWSKLPPTAIPATFILLEFLILSQLAARLWQMASVTTWYKQYAEAVPAELAYTTPQPEAVKTETPVVAEAEVPPVNEPETPAMETSQDTAIRDDL
jgi:hypothetical protein